MALACRPSPGWHGSRRATPLRRRGRARSARALSRRVTETDSILGSLGSAYDLTGRRTQLTWPDGFHVNYGYDLYGDRRYAVANGDFSGNSTLAVWLYDDLGRLTDTVRLNGATTAHAYDPVSRLASITHNPSGTTNDVAIGFAWNPAGQITQRSVSNPLFLFDNASGAGQQVSTVDGLNRVTAVGADSATYDTRSNLTALGSATYSYDAENRLTASGGSTYAYDPTDRRRSTTTSGTTTRLLYDGGQLIATYPATGTTPTAHYVPGLGLDDLAAYLTGTAVSTATYPLADERGSVIASTDTSGVVTGVTPYDEYGLPGAVTPFGYTGQQGLPGGLYDYRTRAYAPNLGRFLQPDTAGYQAGLNLYGYVGGDPMNFTDPWGMLRYETFRYCLPQQSPPAGGSTGSNATGGTTVEGLTVTACRLGYITIGFPDETTIADSFGPGDLGDGGSVGEPAPPRCYGPPAAPGTGVSQAQLRAQTRNNARIAEQQRWSLGTNLFWFRDQVSHGNWDYKYFHPGFEPYGNYTYGHEGAAMGLGEDFLLRQAGRAAVRRGTSPRGSGSPGFLGILGGSYPYGDDPRDTLQIRRGYRDYVNGCYR